MDTTERMALMFSLTSELAPTLILITTTARLEITIQTLAELPLGGMVFMGPSWDRPQIKNQAVM